ncbi:MAG: hypothetical protein WC205_15700 [Opitutaceae bacterium]|jgi:hypothetical protein
MSTLKHLVAERRVSDSPGQSTSGASQSPALLVFKWDNRSWVLPWSYFLGAHHETAESDEQLTLSFSLCAVVVKGKRLDLLLADIASYRLESLRELPQKYRDGAASAPSIWEITVTPAEVR